ncbi:MAG: AAA family ATPase [Thermaerobacter sp.]|nr:AAA family ATPase [Thermaerobacter sp.]
MRASATPGNWLRRAQLEVRLDADARSHTAQILGVRDRHLVVSVPRDQGHALWVKAGTSLEIVAGDGAVKARVLGRHLKPTPLLVLELEEDLPLRDLVRHRSSRIVAVTSGKGGTGKTFMCVNLALSLATLGHRVALVDADLGTGNVAVHLGLRVDYDLGDVVEGKKRLEEVALPGPLGVLVVPGAVADPGAAHLTGWRTGRLHEAIHELARGHDFVLLDVGAGLADGVQGALLAADEVVLVTSEDPAAMLDAYGVLKILALQGRRPRVRLIFNRVEVPRLAAAGAAQIRSMARKSLGLEVSLLGIVEANPRVSRAARRQTAYALLHPHHPLTQQLREMAVCLAGRRGREGR